MQTKFAVLAMLFAAVSAVERRHLGVRFYPASFAEAEANQIQMLTNELAEERMELNQLKSSFISLERRFENLLEKT